MGRLAALLLLAAAAHAEGLEWKRAAFDWYKPHELNLAAEPPAGVVALGEGLLYYAGPCGERKLLLAFAPEAGVLRVDRDFDGDLAEEAALEMTAEGTWRRLVVDLETPAPVAFCFMRRAAETEPRIALAILAHREGTVVVAGRARRMILLDRDADLRFDHAGDEILLDLDGNGLLDRGSAAESIEPAQPFRLCGKSYVATFEGTAGRDLVVAPSAAEAPARPARWRADRPAGPRAAAGGRTNLEDLVRWFEGTKGEPAPPTYRRAGAIALIGALGTPEAFAYLHRVYRRERDETVARAAIEAMGYKDYADREKDVAAIARGARTPELRRAAVNALHYMGAPLRGEVYKALLSGDEDEIVFAAAAANLGAVGTPEAFALLDEAALRASRVAYRYHAYAAATRYRPAPPPPDLVIGALRQADPRLKTLALRDAARLDLAETMGLALEAAKADATTPELQLAVAEILGASGDADAIRALLPFADGATPALAGRLVDLLRAVRDEEAIAALAHGLGDGSPPVRALVADVLREIPGETSAAAILDRLRKEWQEPALSALVRAAGLRKLAGAAGPIADALRRRHGDRDFAQIGFAALARIGFSDEAVARVVAERLASQDWQERLAAVDCVAASGDAAGAPLLHGRLADPVWQVRLAAAQGLGAVRARESVPLLIALLAKEDRIRVRRAAAESLFRLTGEDYGDFHDIWERWWRERGDGFVLPEKTPERKTAAPGERRTVAEFYGVPVDSHRVAFVLDVSSSMGASPFSAEGSELERAVKETLKVVKAMPNHAKVNVIVFESRIRLWKKGLTTLSAGARKALGNFLAEQRPSGSTNLYDALEAALKLKGVETIYLLSDGDPTTGKFTGEEEILEAVQQLNRDKRAAVHCVALGGGSRLLKRLSEATMGTYVQR